VGHADLDAGGPQQYFAAAGSLSEALHLLSIEFSAHTTSLTAFATIATAPTRALCHALGS